MTLIVMVGLLTYCVILLDQMLSKKTFTVISDLQKKNVALDENRSISLNIDNFDIAIGIFYTGKQAGLQDRLDEYFSYTLQMIDYEIIPDITTQLKVGSTYYWNITNVKMELCKEGRFNNMNETTSSIGITDIYMCPIPDYNITLKGSYSSKTAKFMQVQIDYCT